MRAAKAQKSQRLTACTEIIRLMPKVRPLASLDSCTCMLKEWLFTYAIRSKIS